ncbi:hypothetical protein A8B83_05010 [Rhodobacteraceae bacterium EhC02]|nr:hypothetical protein A8B83_05010 [Rhodobacteraceae bacterium EhC02]
MGGSTLERGAGFVAVARVTGLAAAFGFAAGLGFAVATFGFAVFGLLVTFLTTFSEPLTSTTPFGMNLFHYRKRISQSA